MSLRQKQSYFAIMLAVLIRYIYSCGYEVTIEPDIDGKGHKNNSFHYKKLAKDLNLFKNGKYLDKTEDHKQFGEFWEKIGGTWGGRFKGRRGKPKPDGNHYSYGE